MGFDREGALAEGWTNDEIDAFLAKETPVTDSTAPGGENYVPEWGQKHPDIYAGIMSLLDTLPAAASVSGKAKVGIPLAAAVSAGAGSVKRAIEGKPTEAGDVLFDAAKGAGIETLSRGAGAAIAKLPDLSNWLVGKALKFSNAPTVLSPEEKARAIETYWKHDLQASENGWNKLQRLLNENRIARDLALESGDAAGITLHPNGAIVKGDLPQLLRLGSQREGSYPGYTSEVRSVVNDFAKQGMRTPTAMNQEKMQLQKMLDDASAFGSSTTALPATEARKRLQAGIVKDIADNVPGVAEPNAVMSDLLQVAPHLARSTGRIANQDVIGLKDAVLLQDAFTKETGAIPFLMALAGKARVTERAAHLARGAGNIAGKVPMKSGIRQGLEAAMFNVANRPDAN